MKKIILLFLPLLLNAQVIDTVIRFSDRPAELLYIPQGNKLYINFREHNNIMVLDCSTYQIIKIIQTGGDYTSAAYGIWNWQRNKIYYTFSHAPESVAVIDNQTDSIIKWIDFPAFWPPCYNSTNDKLYVSDGESVAVIDCETDSIIKVIPPQPDNLCHFILWDSIGNKVYCGTSWSDNVMVIDCLTDSVIKAISTGLASPWSAVYNSVRRKLYVGGEFGPGCAVIDAIRDTTIKFLNIWYCDEIQPIWNSIEDKVYWPCDSLCIINCANDSIIKFLPYPVFQLGFASWSNHIYIPCETVIGGQWVGILNILDCHNDSLISRFEIGEGTRGIAYNQTNQLVYISFGRDSSLYVIRDEIPGIEERKPIKVEHLTFEIHPNPAKNVLRVRVPLSVQEIKIFDVSGKLIKEIATSADWRKRNDGMGEIKISLKGINPGIYFLRLGKETKKFLVVK
jgi:YVTN family beta-propeller protein